MRILQLVLIFAVTLLPLFAGAQSVVLVLSPAPTASVLAGTGISGFSGDNAAATAAQFAAPSAMAQDTQGNVYLADTRNHRIRRIGAGGTVTTVAGTGAQGFAGDEGPASQAELDSPAGIVVAADNTLYIADTHNHRIRRIDPAGIIHTFAGTGVAGFSGDGTSATTAQLNAPLGLALGLTGDLYVADAGNHRIRHISSTGTIATVAGDGTEGISADGTQATAAHLDAPAAVLVRPDGSVLIADRRNDRVLLLQTDGTLHTVNTAALALRRPTSVAQSAFGETLIADTGNYRVAQVGSNGASAALGSGEQGTLSTVTAPAQSPLGAPSAILVGSTIPSAFAALDRDHGQLVQVSLPTLTFPDTVVATSSTSHPVTLRNAGTSALTVSGITVPAPFATAASTTCGPAPFALAPGASCTVDAIFTPQTDGTASGLLQVDLQGAASQRVLLSGNGLRTGTLLASSTSMLTSGSVDYAGTPMTLTASVLGGSSTAATGTVTFLDGTAVLGTNTLNASAQGSMTTGALAAGTHTLSAAYSGDVHYQASTSASTVVTVVTPPDFTMSAGASSRITVQSGSAGVLPLTLQPVSGVLNQTVTVAVSGLPAGTTLNVTPVPILLASDPVAVTIAFKLPVSLSARTRSLPWLGCALPLLWPLRRKSHRARQASRRHPGCIAARRLCLATATAAAMFALAGCGGGYLSGSGVTAQSSASTYPVTVTASCQGVSGATLTHTATYTVMVQP